ncbi:MAG: GAF domain-containing protein, partial [Desulfobacteraceae bacterium]
MKKNNQNLIQTISNINQAFLDGRDLESILKKVCREILNLLNNRAILVGLQDPQVKILRLHYLPSGAEPFQTWVLPESENGTAIARIITKQETLLFEHADLPPVFAHSSARPVDGLWFGLPLPALPQPLGALCVHTPDRKSLTPLDREMLTMIAALTAAAIDRFRLRQQHEKHLLELSILNEIGQMLSLDLELDKMLAAIETQVSRAFDTFNFHISLYEQDSEEWILIYARNRGKIDPLLGQRFSIEKGLSGYIIRTRTPLLFRNQNDSRQFHITHGLKLIGEFSNSWMGVPLISADQVVGMMAIQNRQQEYAYRDEDLSLFKTIAAQAANAISRKRHENNLKQSEERYRNLFEQSNDAVIIHQGQKIVEVNSRASGMLGYTKTEMLAMNVLDLTASLDPALIDERVHKASVSETPLIFETRWKKADGSMIDIELSSRALDIRNNIIQGIGRNITARKQVEADLKRQTRQVTFLNRIARRISGELNLKDLLATTVKIIYETFSFYSIALLLADEKSEELSFAAVAGDYPFSPRLNEFRIPVGKGMIGFAAKSGQVQLSNDVTLDPNYYAVETVATRSEMAVPIITGRTVIGVLDLQSDQIDAFDAGDATIMKTLADQIAVAVENARLYEAMQQELGERKYAQEINRTLFAISNAVNTTENLDDLYRSIHNSLANILNVDNFFIALYNRDQDSFSLPYFIDQKDSRDDIVKMVFKDASKSSSLTAELIKTGRPMFYRKADILERARKLNLPPVGTTAETWLGVPLKIKNEVIGGMGVQSYKDPEQYDQKDAELLLSISDQVAIAIQRKTAEDALRQSEIRIKALSQQTEQFSLTAASIIAMQDEKEIFERISRAIVEYSD